MYDGHSYKHVIYDSLRDIKPENRKIPTVLSENICMSLPRPYYMYISAAYYNIISMTYECNKNNLLKNSIGDIFKPLNNNMHVFLSV